MVDAGRRSSVWGFTLQRLDTLLEKAFTQIVEKMLFEDIGLSLRDPSR